MVQAIENWADVEGRVRDLIPDPQRPGYLRMTIDVDDAHDVESYPNLFTPAVGSTLDVALPASRAESASLKVGSKVEIRAARVTPTLAMAHPDHPITAVGP